MFKKAVRDDLNFLFMLGLVCMLMLFGIILLVSEKENSTDRSTTDHVPESSTESSLDRDAQTKQKNKTLPARVSITPSSENELPGPEYIDEDGWKLAYANTHDAGRKSQEVVAYPSEARLQTKQIDEDDIPKLVRNVMDFEFFPGYPTYILNEEGLPERNRTLSFFPYDNLAMWYSYVEKTQTAQVKFFDTQKRKEISSFLVTYHNEESMFSIDDLYENQLIAFGDGQVFDIQTGKRVFDKDCSYSFRKVDEKVLAVMSCGSEIFVYNTENWKPLTDNICPGNCTRADFSEEGIINFCDFGSEPPDIGSDKFSMELDGSNVQKLEGEYCYFGW